MRIWLACFFVLFALAQFFDWLKQFSLPLPIYILGGAFLAVASNYNKIIGSYFEGATDVTIDPVVQQPQLDSNSQPLESTLFTVSSTNEEC